MLVTADRLLKTLIQKVKKYFQIFIPVVKIYQKGFSQEESDSSNLLLSLMKEIEDVMILRFISLEKLWLPNNKTCTISYSFIFRISELTELRSSKRTLCWSEKFWQHIKKWYVSSASRKQEHNGFNISWKLCLNLCSLRWLKPTLGRVNNFKPETLLVPKVLFAVTRIKSSLFHSLIVKNKKKKVSVLQEVCLILEYLCVL